MTMKRMILTALTALSIAVVTNAQTDIKRVYDESLDPSVQIKEAVEKAGKEDKLVMCQVGGNWCRWCLLFSDFVSKDTEITDLINQNFVYIHVNYNPRERGDAEKMRKTEELMNSLGNPARFGFPVFVVLDADGKVVHIQDSSFLEEGKGYNRDKVLRFLKNWTPDSYCPSGR